MSNYATRKDVKALKKELNEKFNTIFKVEGKKSLSEHEQRVYARYKLRNSVDISKETRQKYKELWESDKKEINGIMTKIYGTKLDETNKADALDALKGAYLNHYSRMKPKWYQLTKRYAYWQEKKAIEGFAEKLMGKGITREEVNSIQNETKNGFVLTRTYAFDNSNDNHMIEIINTEALNEKVLNERVPFELSNDNKEPVKETTLGEKEQ